MSVQTLTQNDAAPVLRLADPAATDHLGATLARLWEPGICVFLIGDLGAGKSALARAAIQTALAAEGRYEDVPSPTFTLIQEYSVADFTVVHADLYRLSDPDEAIELGLEDAFADGVALIEWPDRLGAFAPADRLEITLSIPCETTKSSGRLVQIVGRGSRHAALAESLADALTKSLAESHASALAQET